MGDRVLCHIALGPTVHEGTLAAADVVALAARGITATNVFALPEQAMLADLLGRVADGRLQVDIELRLPLDEAPGGLDTMVQRETRGKTVVILA